MMLECGEMYKYIVLYMNIRTSLLLLCELHIAKEVLLGLNSIGVLIWLKLLEGVITEF